ncbi:hypothetical protein CASFOL_005466 [Castilleja foliolosa]|uniref:Uncharacterized protein n=1 Tax=Castilleja foliolosa TaxID=1961234 RepID=A0ABD3E3J0_9LAMI
MSLEWLLLTNSQLLCIHALQVKSLDFKMQDTSMVEHFIVLDGGEASSSLHLGGSESRSMHLGGSESRSMF